MVVSRQSTVDSRKSAVAVAVAVAGAVAVVALN